MADRGKEPANKIPVPRFPPLIRARVFQGLVLKQLNGKAHFQTVSNKEHTVGGNEVGHWFALPDVAVEPETTLQRKDQPVAASRELSVPQTLFTAHPAK